VPSIEIFKYAWKPIIVLMFVIGFAAYGAYASMAAFYNEIFPRKIDTVETVMAYS
jgi:hypothetical protein